MIFNRQSGFIHFFVLLVASISIIIASVLINNYSYVELFAKTRDDLQEVETEQTRTRNESVTVPEDSSTHIDIDPVDEESREDKGQSIITQVVEAISEMISGSKPPVQKITTIDQKYSGIQPYKGAPECTDHSDILYHGLWNEGKGCHYDHTHGTDPSTTIFADIYKSWNQQVSYPWQTSNENMMKHKGYINLYTEAKDGCEKTKNANPSTNPYENYNCITHALYIVHSMGTVLEMNSRYHSFRAIFRVCNTNNPSECGFVQTGGWSDYGTLHCPYKKEHCPLIVDPAPLASDNGKLPDLVAINQPPYRAMDSLTSVQRALKSGILGQFWNSLGPNQIVNEYYPNKYNVIFGSAWGSPDGWSSVDKVNPTVEHFVCMDGSCKYNHSAFQIFTLRLSKLPKGPFSSFTDRQGNISSSCTSESPTCIPFIVSSGVPSGNAILNRVVRIGNADFAPIYDYDVCFNADGSVGSCLDSKTTTSGWIKPMGM